MHNILYTNNKLSQCFLLILLISFSVTAQDLNSWTSPLQPCWKFETEELSTSMFASDNEQSYLSQTNGSIIAINNLRGEKVWELELGNRTDSNIYIFDEYLLVVTLQKVIEGKEEQKSTKTFIRLISPVNGSITKTISFENKVFNEVLINKSTVYLFDNQGYIVATDKELNKVWEKTLNSYITTSPILTLQHLGINTENKTFIEINKRNGVISDQFNVKEKKINKSRLIGDDLIFGGVNGLVYSYNSNKLQYNWVTVTGGRIVEILESNKNILVISDDNFVYLLSGNSGKKLWKTKLSGRLIGSKILNKEFGTFLTYGTNDAVFLNLSNGNYINKISFDESIYFINTPILYESNILIPTNKGIYSYGVRCG